MKVLLMGYYGHGGAGGAVATRHLHFGLRHAGVDSKMLCVVGADPDQEIYAIRASWMEKKRISVQKRLMVNLGLSGNFGFKHQTITAQEAFKCCDVVHINRYFEVFSYLSMPALSQAKPTVLTLHDMWPFTGHCYYSLDCQRWKTGCGRCPYLDIFPPTPRDLTRTEWKLKKRSYERSNLVVVAVSKWMVNMHKDSILAHFPIYYIPNGVDTQFYQPLSKEECRWVFNLPTRKKILLFGAANMNNPIKGGDLILDALANIPERLKKEMVILLFGNGGDRMLTSRGFETIHLGYINNERLKNIAFAAADLFLCPSRAEMQGIVILESMASGTPVVAFDIGGIPDMVHHRKTGYLAKAEDTSDFSSGIVEMLEDRQLRERCAMQGRSVIINEFSSESVVERYIRLFSDLIK
jgi:glycosyltransferase involved in cell wall biosynthesis